MSNIGWRPTIILSAMIALPVLFAASCGSDDDGGGGDINQEVDLTNEEARGQIRLCISEHGTPVWNYDQFSDRYDFLGCIQP